MILLSLIFDRKIGNEQMHFAIGEARSHLINLVKTGYAKKSFLILIKLNGLV